MKVSIVIPVYNERAFIEEVLLAGAGSPIDKEIIVIDDGPPTARACCSRNSTKPNQRAIAKPSCRTARLVFRWKISVFVSGPELRQGSRLAPRF